jgi:hypothetical protein
MLKYNTTTAFRTTYCLITPKCTYITAQPHIPRKRWVYLHVLNDEFDDISFRLSCDVTQCPTVNRDQRFGENIISFFRVEKIIVH